MTQKLKLTTRGRYAVMAMVELAQSKNNEPVPLANIAKSGNISLSYLEQLFAGLRRHGVVKSYRGPGGGYVLARPAKDILISDILSSAEDCVPAKRAANNDAPSSFGNVQTLELWDYIGHFLFIGLKNITLADVLGRDLDNLPLTHKIGDLSA